MAIRQGGLYRRPAPGAKAELVERTKPATETTPAARVVAAAEPTVAALPAGDSSAAAAGGKAKTRKGA